MAAHPVNEWCKLCKHEKKTFSPIVQTPPSSLWYGWTWRGQLSGNPFLLVCGKKINLRIGIFYHFRYCVDLPTWPTVESKGNYAWLRTAHIPSFLCLEVFRLRILISKQARYFSVPSLELKPLVLPTFATNMRVALTSTLGSAVARNAAGDGL